MNRLAARRLLLTLALMFVILPCLLLLAEQPGTAPFVISIATLAIGVILTCLTTLVIVISERRRSQNSIQEEYRE